MKVAKIRESFLNYFKEYEHQIVSSSPLVPGNDKTLLFTNAGMVQFKDVFLGLEKRDYQRAVTSQKCVRAGGKHNDLDNVGYTARHHTFFEMLGNFSFGDYFKKEAIHFAWTFLTEVLKLPKEKLWVTVYEDDKEAEDIWFNDIGIDKTRFSRCGEKDNFWSMGDVGPCGPCSEIFFDHGEAVFGGPPGSPDEDGDRYVEIWNLVFMQYDRAKDGSLKPLPKPSVDTGMGLERIAAVMQGVCSNYDIDLFKDLIDSIAIKVPDVSRDNPSLKVIADHIRACSFLIIDGVLPSNEGRGYVLRRIIRRALRHGQKLGFELPFFYEISQKLIELMADAYPQLQKQQAHIESVLKDEEIQFAKTLAQGLKLLEEDISQLKTPLIKGETLFKLYDTYGFPVDLTADIARERNLEVDLEAFNQLMEQRKEASRESQRFSADELAIDTDLSSSFKGYEKVTLDTVISGIFSTESKAMDDLNEGEKGAMVLPQTPFYAESGGQVGDSGEIQKQDALFIVEDTQNYKNAIVHFGYVKSGTFKINDAITASIDANRREKIRANHSATHLLHAALKAVLGEQVQQKGSMVNEKRARFDFSHRKPVSVEEQQKIEFLINQNIAKNHQVQTEIMSIDEAKASGAVALFGEKYSEKVRVLTMGEFSKELCGGTHVTKTGDIGFCKIISTDAIASGIRRMEIATQDEAITAMHQKEDMLLALGDVLKGSRSELIIKAENLLENLKKQQKEIDALKAKLSSQSSDDLLKAAKDIKGYTLLAQKVDGADMASLRTMADKLKNKLSNGIIVLVGIDDKKMSVITALGCEAKASGLKAVTFVKHLCGKGGGRDDMAQSGGLVPEDLAEKMASLETLIV